MPTLTQAEAERLADTLEGWTLEERSLVKRFVFGGFPQAVEFVTRLVPGAEAADHHPDIAIHYTRVTLTYTTHSAGGLTVKDFAGAAMADLVSAARAE